MLTEKRSQVMDVISRHMKAQAAEFGTEVIDVRIGRTDLPEATAQAVYNRMRSDRVAHAAKLRAEGEEQKLKIQAIADKDRTIIIAEAQRESEILRGQGEGERNQILGEAFGQDLEFFDFYRSMEAYGEALGEGTTMVLSPDSEFFRYFGSDRGPAGGQANPVPPADSAPTGTLQEGADAGAGSPAQPAREPAAAPPARQPAGTSVPAAQ